MNDSTPPQPPEPPRGPTPPTGPQGPPTGPPTGPTGQQGPPTGPAYGGYGQGGYGAGGYGGPPPQQQPAPKSGGTGKKWLLLGGAGAAALLVITLIAALVIPRLMGPSSVDSENTWAIADLPERPTFGWQVDYDLGDMGYDWGRPDVVSTGGDTAVVVTRLTGWGDYMPEDDMWYQGIEEDYQRGWDMCQEWEDSGDTDPWGGIPSEYWASEQQGLTSTFGYDVGWDDCEWVGRHGASLPAAPEQPSTEVPILGIDLSNGDELWQIDALTAFDEFNLADGTTSGVVPVIQPAYYVEDSDAIVLTWTQFVEEETLSYLAILDAADGTVLTQTAVDTFQQLVPYRDGVVLVGADTYSEADDNYQASLEYRRINNFDDAEWVSDVELLGQAYGYIREDTPFGDFFQVSETARDGQSNNTYGVNLEDGSIIDDLTVDRSAGHEPFEVIGDTLIERNNRSGEVEIRGLDTDLRSTWDRPVNAYWANITDNMLLTSDSGRDGYSLTGLMRVDPETGEDMWDRSLRADFSHLAAGTSQQAIILAGSEEIIVVDPETGEELWNDRLEGLRNVHPGDEFLYVLTHQELSAYDWEDGYSNWRWTYGGQGEGVDESLDQVGQYLLHIDHQNYTISILE